MSDYPRKLAMDSIPGEVHQHMKELGELKHDLLWRFEHINQNWIVF